MESQAMLADIMPPRTRRELRFSPEIDAAIDAYCEAHGVEFSMLVRRLVCTEIGRPELVNTMRLPGRPKPAPPKKAAKKKK